MSNKLDLHGVKHQDVELLVENFVYMNQDKFPLIVICGNSSRMISLTKQVLDRIVCEYTSFRYGTITINRFK